MTQNFRFAWRSLLRSRTYTLTAIGSLALGIGGAVAIFAIVEAVLLRELPYRQPERLVRIVGATRGAAEGTVEYLLSPPQFDLWRHGTRTLEGLALFRPGAGNLTGISEPRQVNLLRVSAEFFSTLGYRPELGRWLTLEEERDPAVRRIVISHSLWKSAYAGDREIVGKTVYLDGIAQEVVGVAPATFWLPGGRDLFPLPQPISVFLPLQVPASLRTGTPAFFYCAIGRLAKGATAGQAAEELTAKPAPVNWKTTLPPPELIEVQPLQAKVVEKSQKPLLLLLGSVLFLLLIVCVNVGSLTIARWERDRKGLTIRASLGASWRQLAGLCLAESSLLAGAGTSIGVLLASWLMDVVQMSAGVSLPRLELSGLNGVVLLFSAGIGGGAALLIGLLPAVRIARQSSQWEQGLTSRGGTETGGARGLQKGLVSVQAALAVVLLSGAVLFLVSLHKLLDIPDGYDADRVVTAKLVPSRPLYPSARDRQALTERLMEAVGRIPGVVTAAASTSMPNEVTWKLTVETEETKHRKEGSPSVYYVFVTRSYFAAMGIPLLNGRIPEDQVEGERQVTISLATAKAAFPGVNPIGRILQNGVGGPPERVVGVVGDVRPEGLDQPPANMVYRNFQFTGFGGDGTPQIIVMARTGLSGEAMASDIRRAIASVDSGLAVPSVQTLRQVPRPEVSLRQLEALLTSGFGLLGLILAVAGVYGVVAFSLTRRRKELAIRMALGADRTHIRGIVWREALLPVAWGLLPGVLGAVGMGVLLRGLLFEVSPMEPRVLVATPLLLLTAAMVPAHFLSKRAERIEPATVMQNE